MVVCLWEEGEMGTWVVVVVVAAGLSTGYVKDVVQCSEMMV